MHNNSDARRVDGKTLAGCPAKHNGGKVVFLVATDVAAATDALDRDHCVASYIVEVVS